MAPSDVSSDAAKPLANNFDLTAGSVTFNVPCDNKIKSRATYVVVLMGDSGNKSAKFTIRRDASKCPAVEKKQGSKDKQKSEQKPKSSPSPSSEPTDQDEAEMMTTAGKRSDHWPSSSFLCFTRWSGHGHFTQDALHDSACS